MSGRRTKPPRAIKTPKVVRRYCMTDPAAELTDGVILQHIPDNTRVIDLGCGDGRLLERLREERKARVLGVEWDLEQVLGTVRRGVAVIQADLDHRLPDIPSNSFDVAVLSQTLQQVRRPKTLLVEMLRIAQRALVVIPNFGYWRIRLQVLRYGRAPVTEELPYEWYNTPNLHFMTMTDVCDLAAQLGIHVRKIIPLINGRAVENAWAPNLRAQNVFYVLERPEAGTVATLEASSPAVDRRDFGE